LAKSDSSLYRVCFPLSSLNIFCIRVAIESLGPMDEEPLGTFFKEDVPFKRK